MDQGRELPLTGNQLLAVEVLDEVQELQEQIRQIQRRLVAKARSALAYAVDADVVIEQRIVGQDCSLVRYVLREPSSFLEFDVEEWINIDPLRDVVGTDDVSVLAQMGDLISECAFAMGGNGGFDAVASVQVFSEKLQQERALREAEARLAKHPRIPYADADYQAVLDARAAADAASEAQAPPALLKAA